MTRTNSYWAIGISPVGTWFGISVMFGHIPGLESDVGTFRRLAAVVAMAVHEYGYALTGFGTIVSGIIMGALCIVSGKGTPDSGLGTD